MKPNFFHFFLNILVLIMIAISTYLFIQGQWDLSIALVLLGQIIAFIIAHFIIAIYQKLDGK